MIRVMIAQDIMMLECELTAYRKGCLLFRINLEQGTLIWKDSRQWCNNFVRTLSDDQTEEMRRLAAALVETAAAEPVAGPEGDTGSTLLMTIHGREACQTFDFSQLDPTLWHQLRRAVERLSRSPFRL